MKKLNLLFQIGFMMGSIYLLGCAQKKISEKTTSDTSENIFTGSETETKETKTRYQDQMTGEVSTETKHEKIKYDKDGNVISETEKTERDKNK